MQNDLSSQLGCCLYLLTDFIAKISITCVLRFNICSQVVIRPLYPESDELLDQLNVYSTWNYSLYHFSNCVAFGVYRLHLLFSVYKDAFVYSLSQCLTLNLCYTPSRVGTRLWCFTYRLFMTRAFIGLWPTLTLKPHSAESCSELNFLYSFNVYSHEHGSYFESSIQTN